MKEILGKKLGMTRIFRESGEVIPCTVIQAGPCPIIDRRTQEKHGYDAYRVGFGERKKVRVTRPIAGQFAASKVVPTHFIREVVVDGDMLEIGAELKVDLFHVGERVDITGTSRGLGFAGVMKRHHFAGANTTHGQSDRTRAPGSLGQSSYPSRVFKGLRMAGRMGRDKVTNLNLEVVDIIADQNLMLVKGTVPGFNGSLVKIRSTNRGR